MSNFKEGQKVIVVFGTIMNATIIRKKTESCHDRYVVKYEDGTEGDPCSSLIFASRKEYYEIRIKATKALLKHYKKLLEGEKQ